ncbi:rod shape-determining protein RodA [Orenia metallireducens]|uniref:Peptidoglycan glycosyltransferase RodA n=1 Tax=Orenia metallireducens TaxID=1413210 RepID=A0A1C0A582_9FIRM|nr:rod shape-determining protein RodA [Orenia metallireducens]OCL25266.1 rod shape-determining protein RodA [Orenia metallireducens]
MIIKKLIKNIDYLIPIITLLLIITGLVIIGSATNITDNPLLQNTFLKKQIIAAIVGIILVIISLFFDYRILRDYVSVIYVLNILILLTVLFFGSTIKGGQGWIRLGPVNFQPAETAKLAVIIALADVLAKGKYNVYYILGLIVPGIYIGVPFILVLLQNDLGSALVLIAIFVGMIYVAGANAKFLVGTFLSGIGTVVAWITVHIYWGVPIPLKQYQLNRLLVLVNPQLDPLGAGYNVIQSKIAIGSGGLLGKGLFGGTQNQLNFLPERHTDFIFSVLGEEFGFIGALLILLLYLLLLWRGVKVAMEAKDEFGQLLVVGILSMFAFHILENVGMTIGIMPVTGIPLPFLSYGGSSLLTNLMAIAIIMNVNIRRKKMLF